MRDESPVFREPPLPDGKEPLSPFFFIAGFLFMDTSLVPVNHEGRVGDTRRGAASRRDQRDSQEGKRCTCVAVPRQINGGVGCGSAFERDSRVDGRNPKTRRKELVWVSAVSYLHRTFGGGVGKRLVNIKQYAFDACLRYVGWNRDQLN